jgi:hypothetical protein
MGPAPSRISAPTRPFAAAPARSPQRARKGEEPKMEQRSAVVANRASTTWSRRSTTWS